MCLSSVGCTPQTPDNCVCCRHVVNVGPTHWRHSVVSANILAVRAVSVRLVTDTLSYMFVGISTNEVEIGKFTAYFLSSRTFRPLTEYKLCYSSTHTPAQYFVCSHK